MPEAENKITKSAVGSKMKVSKTTIAKSVELAIAGLCIGFHCKSRTNDFECDTLSAAAFGGYIIICIGALIGHLVQMPLNKKLDVFFCLAGCAVFVAAGTLNINYFERFTKSEWKYFGTAKGILAIVNGGVFLVDCLIIWRETI